MDGFEEAEMLIRETIEGLLNIIDSRDCEDITCYNHSCLDSYITNLVNAKALMGIAAATPPMS